MKYLNDEGIILCLPREDRMLLIGAIVVAMDELKKETLTKADQEALERLIEIKNTLVKAH